MSVSTVDKLTRADVTCGIGTTYRYSESKSISLYTGKTSMILENENWSNNRVYCETDIRTSNATADIKNAYIDLSAIKDTPEPTPIIPTITAAYVSPESASAGSEFTFVTTLSAPLPEGYNVYMNFDNLRGGWFNINDAGGHTILESIGKDTTVRFTRSIISSSGTRSVRFAIFKGSTKSENYNVSGYQKTVNFTVR